MSTEGWPGPMAPSPQPPPPDPMLDHLVPIGTGMQVVATGVGTLSRERAEVLTVHLRKLADVRRDAMHSSRGYLIRPVGPAVLARPGGAKPIKPAKPARPPKGPRRPFGTPPKTT